MSRKKPDPKNQLTFSFEVSPEDIFALEGGSPEGLSDFDFRLRQVLKTTLDDVAKRDSDPLDRYEVAARMSRTLGREIAKSHIDQWVAMATVARRIHADALRALCEVTGDMRPIHYFVESCGLKALDPKMALCAEWGAAEVVKKNLTNKQRTLGNELDGLDVINALAERLLGGKA